MISKDILSFLESIFILFFRGLLVGFSDSIGGKYNKEETACAYLLDWADAEEDEVIQKMRLFEAHYGASYGLFTKESGELI